MWESFSSRLQEKFESVSRILIASLDQSVLLAWETSKSLRFDEEKEVEVSNSNQLFTIIFAQNNIYRIPGVGFVKFFFFLINYFLSWNYTRYYKWISCGPISVV